MRNLPMRPIDRLRRVLYWTIAWLVAGLVFFAICFAAQAADFDYNPQAPGAAIVSAKDIIPLHDARIDDLVRRSATWWAQYGRTAHQYDDEPCTTTNVYVANVKSDENAEAPQPGCYMILGRMLMFESRPTIKESLTYYERLIALANVVCHEYGHMTGKGHEDHGVMVPIDFDEYEMPQFILPWVAQQLGARRMAALRRDAGARSNWSLFRDTFGLDIKPDA